VAFAVVSDVHSNIEALTRVFEDLDAQGITDLICLGDVIGYGPNPIECADLMQSRARVTLKGNHDEALVHGAYAFNMRAQKAIDWTRDQLKPGFFSSTAVRKRWEFLSNLPLRHEEYGFVFIHGSPRDPTNEYLLPTEIGFGPNEKFEEIFASFDRALFVGHTHLPCVITSDYETASCVELDYEWDLNKNDSKVIINIGSVGQPRDRDNRSSYVVVDDGVIRWRRVEYEFEKTAEKIERVPQLDNALGARLKEGI